MDYIEKAIFYNIKDRLYTVGRDLSGMPDTRFAGMELIELSSNIGRLLDGHKKMEQQNGNESRRIRFIPIVCGCICYIPMIIFVYIALQDNNALWIGGAFLILAAHILMRDILNDIS